MHGCHAMSASHRHAFKLSARPSPACRRLFTLRLQHVRSGLLEPEAKLQFCHPSLMACG